MLARRSDCPVACTLDLIGDRWTLLVLRDMCGGKRRFDEFLASPEAIATNVLSDRLARLERERFATRERDPEDGRRVVYELTERGRSLLPVIMALRDWGLKHCDATDVSQFVAMAAQTGAAASARDKRKQTAPRRRTS